MVTLESPACSWHRRPFLPAQQFSTVLPQSILFPELTSLASSKCTKRTVQKSVVPAWNSSDLPKLQVPDLPVIFPASPHPLMSFLAAPPGNGGRRVPLEGTQVLLPQHHPQHILKLPLPSSPLPGRFSIGDCSKRCKCPILRSTLMYQGTSGSWISLLPPVRWEALQEAEAARTGEQKLCRRCRGVKEHGGYPTI